MRDYSRIRHSIALSLALIVLFGGPAAIANSRNHKSETPKSSNVLTIALPASSPVPNASPSQSPTPISTETTATETPVKESGDSRPGRTSVISAVTPKSVAVKNVHVANPKSVIRTEKISGTISGETKSSTPDKVSTPATATVKTVAEDDPVTPALTSAPTPSSPSISGTGVVPSISGSTSGDDEDGEGSSDDGDDEGDDGDD